MPVQKTCFGTWLKIWQNLAGLELSSVVCPGAGRSSFTSWGLSGHLHLWAECAEPGNQAHNDHRDREL